MTGSTSAFGDHYLVDYHGCDPEIIQAVEPTQEALLLAATRCGSTIIEYHFHQFSPHGVSGIILIAESHISVHTWPERDFAAFDIFMCGDAKPEMSIPVLKQHFYPERMEITEHLRGMVRK